MKTKKKKKLPHDQMKFNLLKRLLRAVFRQLPEYKEVYQMRRCQTQGKKNLYMCDGCRKPFGQKFMAVDHKDPIGGYYKWKLSGRTLSNIVDLVWCDVDNLQLLCKTCHDSKTALERKVNSSHKKEWVKRNS